jgi:hypothetical protein
MAVIVVGGSSKGAGKTALMCGLLVALPEFAWTAVKITTHAHGKPESVWEETESGQGTDTARFLAAGARRAFLVTAGRQDLALQLRHLFARLDPGAHFLFESNRIMAHLEPDLCLVLEADPRIKPKPSLRMLSLKIDAQVMPADRDFVSAGDKPLFHLVALDRISAPMQSWLRDQLRNP